MSIEKLKQMEGEGKYVFHGSPEGDIESLEPRQGRHVPDWSKPSETILDGNPAVCTTPYVELATFRAIINAKNIPINHTSSFGIKNGKIDFEISSKEVLNVTKDKKGFVYVFDRKEFEPYNRDREATQDAMEWRSHKTVKPIEVVEVGFDDLMSSDQIKITE